MYLGASEGTKPFLSPTHLYTNEVKVNSQMAPGITLVSAENLETWVLDIQILDDNPIYQGKTYRLQLNFTSNYPIGKPHLDIFMACGRLSAVILTHLRCRSTRGLLHQGAQP